MSLLKEKSLFWSRLGFEYDPAIYDDDGKLMSFGEDYTKFARYHADMAKIGIGIHTSILFSGWVDEDAYDYTLTDKALDALFSAIPDALYIPRVKLNAPMEWMKKHPEELFVYYGGPEDPEKIRPLVGGLKHDILGYESSVGYYKGKDSRPNLNGVISNQSFASERWKMDAGKALENLMQHIAEGPYADKIIGYHIAYGACGETCLWGRASGRFGDYSRVFRNAFGRWGVNKYGSENKRKEMWGSFEIPLPDERHDVNDSAKAFCRGRRKDRITIDLDRFSSEMNAELIKYFCGIVKDKSNGKMYTGAFYGYILECHNAAYTGWADFDNLLNSSNIDFWASPSSYYRRAAGESGGFMAPVDSINRKHFWIEELDIRTFLSKENNFKIPKECTEATLHREVAKNLATGSGYWWMDLGGGWFDSPMIKECIKKIESRAEQLRKISRKSVADILFIVDEETYFHQTQSGVLFGKYAFFRREAAMSGAISDLYRLRDLPELDMSQYKLIVMHNVPVIDDMVRALLMRTNAVKLFMYLDGSINRSSFSLKNTEELTGIKLKESGRGYSAGKIICNDIFSGEILFNECDLPKILICSGKVYARFSDGSAVVVSNDGKIFYSVLPVFEWKQFCELAKYSGCHLYGDAPSTVYGDSRFYAIFPHNKPSEYIWRER